MIQAVIFDFDGVIADTEPLHYQAFAGVLVEHSILLSADEYFSHYVGLNDETLIRTIFADRGQPLDDQTRRRILASKDAAYQARIGEGIPLLPGVEDFIRDAAQHCTLAICSGARGIEIQTILNDADLTSLFSAIVSADEVAVSKPSPAGFLRTLDLLRAREPQLAAERCLVLEDSVLGIRAARAAGMKVLALLGAVHHLTSATRVAAEADASRDNLVGVNIEELWRDWR